MVSSYLRVFVLGLVAITTLNLCPSRAEAQKRSGAVATRSAIQISIAGIDKIMEDIRYLTQAAGMPQFGGLAQVIATPYLEGVDTKRPIGAAINFAGTAPSVVVFLPIADFDQVLNVLKQNVGEPESIGNGVLRLVSNREFYIKERNGWAFVSNKQDNLVNLPTNPGEDLGDLPKNYSIAFRVNVQNIPQSLRDTALSELKAGFERRVENELSNIGDGELEAKVARSALKSVTSLIEDSDQVTLGLSINPSNKNVHLDLSQTALPGTDLAEQMQALSNLKTSYSGFSIPGAALLSHTTWRLTPDDIQQARGALQALGTAAGKEIDGDGNGANAKSALKEAVSQLLASIDATIGSGKIDGAASLVLRPNATKFIAGVDSADVASFEGGLRKLADVAKAKPQFSSVQFDVERHRNIRFHNVVIPIPAHEEEPRKFFGDALDVSVGIGEQSVYLAVGKDNRQVLKSAIDASATSGAKEAWPLQLTLSLQEIFDVAAAMEPNPAIAAAATQLKNTGGRDHIHITGKPISSGIRYRLDIEDGVISAAGQVFKKLQQNGRR